MRERSKIVQDVTPLFGVFTLGYHAITQKSLKRIEAFLHAANLNSVHLHDG